MSLRRNSYGKASLKTASEPRRGTWTAEEDSIIIDCIQEGFSKWSDIGKRIPNERTGKQCRERWFNHLDPQLKKEPWTDEEDAMLIAAQRRLGNSWTRIATEMPGRSENEVKNRWYSAAIRNKHMLFQASGPKRRLMEVTEDVATFIPTGKRPQLQLQHQQQQPPQSNNNNNTLCVPLRIPSLFRGGVDSLSLGALPKQLLLSHPQDHGADLTSPEGSLLQLPQWGEGQSIGGSGLTTPLSFFGGALSGFNSGSGSPTWFETGAGAACFAGGASCSGGSSGFGGAGAGTGGAEISTTLSTATAGTVGSGGSVASGRSSQSDSDTVTEALQLLLQDIATSSSSCATTSYATAATTSFTTSTTPYTSAAVHYDGDQRGDRGMEMEMEMAESEPMDEAHTVVFTAPFTGNVTSEKK